MKYFLRLLILMTHYKLQNIPVSPKLVNKIIPVLDSSKVPGTDYTQVMVGKN